MYACVCVCVCVCECVRVYLCGQVVKALDCQAVGSRLKRFTAKRKVAG